MCGFWGVGWGWLIGHLECTPRPCVWGFGVLQEQFQIHALENGLKAFSTTLSRPLADKASRYDKVIRSAPLDQLGCGLLQAKQKYDRALPVRQQSGLSTAAQREQQKNCGTRSTPVRPARPLRGCRQGEGIRRPKQRAAQGGGECQPDCSRRHSAPSTPTTDPMTLDVAARLRCSSWS